MIIRDLGTRHGRKALARPLIQASTSCIRSLTTSLTEPPASETTSDPSGLPALFTKSIRTPYSRGKRKPTAPDTTKQDWELTTYLKKTIGKLGAKVERTYSPFDVFNNPPGPKDVTLELLMASQSHMGHHASIWNPATSRYIYGIRQGIHIISLEQTAAHLRRAARVVEEVAFYGGLILFVGTRPGQSQVVTQAAKLAKGCQLFTKWAPGTITNSEKILPSAEIKIVDQFDEELNGFRDHLMERRALVPDLVVCFNPKENFPMLYECSQCNVPTIGVIDTDAEPSWVTYAIPANDDSFRCLALIGSVLGRAGEMGQERRLKAAKEGNVTWETPLEIQAWLAISMKRREWAEKFNKEVEEQEKAEAKAALGTLSKEVGEEARAWDDKNETEMAILERLGVKPGGIIKQNGEEEMLSMDDADEQDTIDEKQPLSEEDKLLAILNEAEEQVRDIYRPLKEDDGLSKDKDEPQS